MKIVLITPYGRQDCNGNWHTAARWRGFLRDAGHKVHVQMEWDGKPADLMVALHARRSAPSIKAFAGLYPSRPLIVTLTGTDLYRDIHADEAAQTSLQLAHRLVVLQEKGIQELSPSAAAKTRVIYQSAPDISRNAERLGAFNVLVVGHLREEKDPFRPALASAYLAGHSQTQITHLGRALSKDMADLAYRAERQLTRWQWAGDTSHKKVLQKLASAHLLVISSIMEGGANVICEALAANVPVIASDIPGNIGMLGDDYPGYFPVGNERRLARMISLAEHDPDFYAELVSQCRERRRLMRPEREASSLRQLIGEFEISLSTASAFTNSSI
ncbi:MAG: selenoneine biosynthesis selenosugar synthase SenB [Thiobacillaceae bacterium]